MDLTWQPYSEVCTRWPAAGHHILASYDAQEIVVYQAYAHPIADYALEHQRFGGPFSLRRMSWIKPNFLWMMYRCGWAQKENQERVLAVHLRAAAFEAILAQAVWSSYQPESHASEKEWSADLDRSEVRLQWDPDHDPSGQRQARRAIQLGLRGKVLEAYAQEWLVRIEDLTPLVHEQQQRMRDGHSPLVPDERPFTVADPTTRLALKLDAP